MKGCIRTDKTTTDSNADLKIYSAELVDEMD
jgi:hypothetical protein